MMKEFPVLHTERLTLRPFSDDDGPAVELLAGDERVADTTLTIPHPYPTGGAVEWIATHRPGWEAGTELTLAITDRMSGELLGAISLAIKQDHERAELGYWVGVPFWNRGYCTEASLVLIDFAFATLKLERVYSHHFTRNPASGRVMQKIGMKFEGIQRSGVKKGDRFEDLACYAILSTDHREPETLG